MERVEVRLENHVRMNNELHERILDLEAQVMKANANLRLIVEGLRKYIEKTTPAILRSPFVASLDYVEGLIDWELTIDVERYEQERKMLDK
jgi:hypothetical protein